jgi:spore coat protein A
MADQPPCTAVGSNSFSCVLPAAKDNTIYQEVERSFGAGPCFMAGRTGGLAGFNLRRALIAFDLDSIPAGAVIQQATLRLVETGGNTAAFRVWLHPLRQDWGEGGAGVSDACGPGGPQTFGRAPTGGDATWQRPFFGDSLTWAGGDFQPAASESILITTGGAASGTNPWTIDVTSEVLGWIARPADNHGWILIGDESTAFGTARQFASKDNPDPTLRPTLTVHFTRQGACCDGQGSCSTRTPGDCAQAHGAYQGDGTQCEDVDCLAATLQPYADPLPIPPVAVPAHGQSGGEASYVITMLPCMQQLHRDLPPTALWGYDGRYPGPTIEAASNKTVKVRWVNGIGDHLLAVDRRLHGPDAEPPAAPPRMVVHLHGAHVPPESDGYPESTFVAGQWRDYEYPNTQRACTLWYHDHALGNTRVGVMSGLAGFYILRQPEENQLGLPSDRYEIPLLVQDRTLNADGTLSYDGGHWMSSFAGHEVLVNGKVWPYLYVDQGKYRFRVLNGSNSRFYTLALSDRSTFWAIGTDGGLLSAPVPVTAIQLGPAERADIVVDFEHAHGNVALEDTAASGNYRRVMLFKVNEGSQGWTQPLPASLRQVQPIPESEAVQPPRKIDVDIVKDPVTKSRFRLGELDWDDISEFPEEGTTEIWTFVNKTGIPHPIHIHLVQFQILDRQHFTNYDGQGNPIPDHPPAPPDSYEAGWKDTARLPPNTIMRLIARFTDYTGNYVFHCHILEHEDNDMMRQFTVLPHSEHRPVTGTARAEPDSLVPADGLLAPVTITGVTSPGGDPVDIHVTKITQDEPIAGADVATTIQEADTQGDSAVSLGDGAGVGRHGAGMDQGHHGRGDSRCYDARIDGLGRVSLRRERLPEGNGRVYRVHFIAVAKGGGAREGSVTVSVPRDGARIAVDDGQLYDSLRGCTTAFAADQAMAMHMAGATHPAATTWLGAARLEGRIALIDYSVARPAPVSIALYDVAGRRQAHLDETPRESGRHTAQLDLAHVAPGIYFVRMRVQGASYSARLVMIDPPAR